MPTSTRFAVAVHILAALAINEGCTVPSEQLASSASTNPTVIRRILSMLADAGLTTSQLGYGGGAMLAKSADKISLLDIFHVVEDPEIFVMHRTPPDQGCFVGRSIQAVLAKTTTSAQRALENELGQVTIADVARDLTACANAR